MPTFIHLAKTIGPLPTLNLSFELTTTNKPRKDNTTIKYKITLKKILFPAIKLSVTITTIGKL